MDLPIEFKNKYRKLLGEKDSQKFFEAIDGKKINGFRLNPLKQNYKNVSYDLSDKVPFIDNGFYGKISGNDIEWLSGYVYSQDPSAMFPAQISQVKPGQRVLDLCAAPGGKSTALASKLADQGILVANEISSSRVKKLRENLEKWGSSNVLITNESPDKLVSSFKNYFDTILVDAPCSGEGMFRKDPEAMKYWSQDYVLTCQSRQKEILQHAYQMLAPGGKLVYSTCTFSPEEDEQIVEWLVNKYKMQVLPIDKFEGMAKGRVDWTKNNTSQVQDSVRFWFQDGVGEGQYVALLQKNKDIDNAAPKSKKKPSKKSRNSRIRILSKEEKELIDKQIYDFALPDRLKNWKKEALISNEHVFVPIIAPKDLTGLRIINNGVELGIMKKNRFEPGQQLAQVLGQRNQDKIVKLDDQEFEKYLHGEAIKLDTTLKGFVLVTYQDKIFSFGKIGGDKILKNYYPKGLRK
ncbi:RsmF rRNA methyltransferase first C-terminal domain-containing protein [uncultured Lactobacillus sp.]|uniref:RsmF rRNA methyltransferase first C-terminal domain-containing protein n=1 Tax=uncultured Lactobacillus sp. TaxID=153152 RepID=UPI0026157613|nr:RsmF rRNA methyltransferase first C-terminal domain-containing protein [uncultured Lactobacillus sp.]